MQTKQSTLLSLVGLVIILSAVLTFRADANSSRPPAQPTAIAVVDIMNVLDGLNERTVLKSQLDARMNTRQEQLDEVLKQLEALDADINLLTPGTDAYRDKFREGMEKQAVAKTRRDILSQIVSIDTGTVMAGLYSKIEAAISDIADREGYDIVLFDDSSFQVPSEAPNADVIRAIITKSIVYRHDSIDITEQVVTLMNNEYSAP